MRVYQRMAVLLVASIVGQTVSAQSIVTDTFQPEPLLLVGGNLVRQPVYVGDQIGARANRSVVLEDGSTPVPKVCWHLDGSDRRLICLEDRDADTVSMRIHDPATGQDHWPWSGTAAPYRVAAFPKIQDRDNDERVFAWQELVTSGAAPRWDIFVQIWKSGEPVTNLGKQLPPEMNLTRPAMHGNLLAFEGVIAAERIVLVADLLPFDQGNEPQIIKDFANARAPDVGDHDVVYESGREIYSFSFLDGSNRPVLSPGPCRSFHRPRVDPSGRFVVSRGEGCNDGTETWLVLADTSDPETVHKVAELPGYHPEDAPANYDIRVENGIDVCVTFSRWIGPGAIFRHPYNIFRACSGFPEVAK